MPQITQGTNTFIPPFRFAQMFQLSGGHEWIRGVVIDNANSPLPVYIWPGRSPNAGTPQIVLPTWSRGFTFGGISAIYLLIQSPSSPPFSAGTVFVHLSGDSITAFSSNAASQASPAFPPIIPPINQ